MKELPDAVYIVDAQRIAVAEARKLDIPIIAMWTPTVTPMK